jgi:hypothetical protein
MSTASYPPEATDALLTALTDYCLSHGVTVRPPPPATAALATPAPVSLYPSLFPRTCFDAGRTVQPAYNAVYAAVANDTEWLGAIVQE